VRSAKIASQGRVAAARQRLLEKNRAMRHSVALDQRYALDEKARRLAQARAETAAAYATKFEPWDAERASTEMAGYIVRARCALLPALAPWGVPSPRRFAVASRGATDRVAATDGSVVRDAVCSMPTHSQHLIGSSSSSAALLTHCPSSGGLSSSHQSHHGSTAGTSPACTLRSPNTHAHDLALAAGSARQAAHSAAASHSAAAATAHSELVEQLAAAHSAAAASELGLSLSELVPPPTTRPLFL
jgi:hypothetical protein